MDRNYPGAARIARLTACTHVLIRLKSDIPLKMVSKILADGWYLAEISGDGVTVTVRVIEYWVTVEGQKVPELFCLVTDLMDIDEYPAADLAALYKWRWDGSETALREAKASLRGGGAIGRADAPLRQPGARPAGARRLGRRHGDDPRRCPRRRSPRPSPPGKDAGPGSRSRPARSPTAAPAAPSLAAIRAGTTSCTALARELAKHRTVIDRNRHRPRKAKCASTFPRAGRADTATRIAAAVITLANTPA